MKSRSRLLGQPTSVLMGVLLALGVTPLLSAQEAGVPVDAADNNFVDMAALRAQNSSSFLLFGEGDRAATGMRPTGSMEFLVTNTGIVDGADLDWDSQPDLRGCANCNPSAFQGFDFAPLYGAGREEWVRFLGQAPTGCPSRGRLLGSNASRVVAPSLGGPTAATGTSGSFLFSRGASPRGMSAG